MKIVHGSMLLGLCENAGQGLKRFRRPRELKTGISEKKVVYNCFFGNSKYLGLGIMPFTDKKN